MLDNATQKFSTAGKSSQMKPEHKEEIIADVGSHMEKKPSNLQNFGIQQCEYVTAHLSYCTNSISSATFL